MKKDDATYTETPVEISGSDDQIKKAKELIQEIIGPSSSVINNMGGTQLLFSFGYNIYIVSLMLNACVMFTSGIHICGYLVLWYN